jgi:sugar/nucleoside kinase (ribokinase family)
MNPLATKKVLCAGLNIVDILVRLPDNVKPGEKHEVETLCVTGGAPAGNAACVMASLGVPTSFITFLGQDAISSVARAELVRCGVLADCFLEDPAARPGVACVTIDPAGGERTVFYNLSGYRRVTAADLRAEWIEAADLVLVDGYETEASLPLLRMAAERDLLRVLDIESGEPSVLREMLALGTDAILSLSGARELSGGRTSEECLTLLSQWTDARLLVTDGVRGSWALAPEGVCFQPAFAVEAIDTTGCGDAYHGAYAAGLLAGWPLSLRMEFAAFIASRVALKMGGRADLPTWNFLAENPHPSWSPALLDAINQQQPAYAEIP